MHKININKRKIKLQNLNVLKSKAMNILSCAKSKNLHL